MLSLGLDRSERPVRAALVNEAAEVLARVSGTDDADAVRQAKRVGAPQIAGVAMFIGGFFARIDRKT